MSGSPVAIVTGASRGIGRAGALALAEAGFDVVVSARTVREGEGVAEPNSVREDVTLAVPGSLERTAQEIEERGQRALIVPMDLSDRSSVEALVPAVLDAWGRIDVLYNNAIFRGRWNGTQIVDGRDIFVGDDVDALYTKMAFGPDGKLYFTIGCPGVGTDESIGRAQKPDDYAGKTLRLNDDGTIPKDNPFAGRKGYNPELFTIGHRVNLGLTLNPWTKDFWVSEHGPQGGDEINVLKAGQNYGWPLVSDGRYYSGTKVSPVPYKDGLTRPHISYVPSIAPGGMLFYTGDKFPGWKGNLFVGAMRMSNSPRTGHLERIVFNEKWEVVRSEMLLFDLHQRIRDVEQSPDGYLYVITDEGADSVLMKIEPGSD